MPRLPSLPANGQVPSSEIGVSGRRKRPRAAVACDTCRSRKVKCDGVIPCSGCVRHSFTCSYKDRYPHIISSRIHHGLRPRDGTTEAELRPAPLVDAAESSDRQPTLPLEADASAVSEPAASIIAESQSFHVENTEPSEGMPSALGHVNKHTGGSEFYGPTGSFYFLSQVRHHAKSGPQSESLQRQSIGSDTEASVINLLHSSDYSLADAQATRLGNLGESTRLPTQSEQSVSDSSAFNLASYNYGQFAHIEMEIQQECIRLYFANLHCVHPVLDHMGFLARCEREVWLNKAPHIPTLVSNQDLQKTRFLALFNVVLANGAITAGETSLLTWDRTINFLERQSGGHAFRNRSPYTPIRVARLYFEKAKEFLGDIFETSSIETTQALFLMSVFCQNALKPHSCYMYSGMALRTALAIGVPTTSHSSSSQESRLWWAMYSFEIEMCSTAGRQSFLQAPSYYRIPLPSPTSVEPQSHFINCMVDLAQILAQVPGIASLPDSEASIIAQSTRSINMDSNLENWKQGLPSDLSLNNSSLLENELIAKQKVVLRLRYLNVKTLIHRPFLLLACTGQHSSLIHHVSSCVVAARETVRFVWDTYLCRPYFRTWWFNCTYTLDATMVLLYVALTKICPCPVEAMLDDVDKSLEIFASMKVLAVARRCTDLTRELLNAAKKSRAQYDARTSEMNSEEVFSGSQSVQLGSLAEFRTHNDQGHFLGDIKDDGLTYEDLYSSLMDTNLLYNILDSEDWNAPPVADS